MRVPVSWLRDWVDVPQEVTPEQLHADLVKVGFEEEDIHTFEVTGPVVVGRVLEYLDEPQSNGKTIRWCQVDVGPADDGGRDVRGIVCGAHNFDAQDLVVVTLPGAVLPGPFPIAARKTYGHVSDGMIASVRELGIGDDHDGILVLSTIGVEAEPGTDAIELLGLDDWAVELNVTPDRGYALSLRGIAREYSHATGAAFRDPALAALERDAPPSTPTSGAEGAEAGNSQGFSVVLEDGAPIRGREGCTLFATRIVRGVDATRPTPAWMVARLKLAGIRSISLLVDITNYVMLELGQPIHGYDLNLLTGGITVRRATAGETLTTLDNQSRTLDTEDLLITDESGPIGLAGVMGGATTEISLETRDVLIEAAHFAPVSIARTARRHKLHSEASKRFERGVDPAVAVPAAARVAQLMVDLAGGTDDGVTSMVGSVPERDAIDLPDGWVDSLIGAGFADREVRDTLEAIGTQIERVDGGLRVTPPTWRPDLATRADLAEEAARILGYDRIPSIVPVAPPGRGRTRPQKLRRDVANMLAANGRTEVLAYPFVSDDDNRAFGTADGSDPLALTLENPLDPAVGQLRTSLLPGLIATAHRNLSRGLTDLDLFEIGLVYRAELTPRRAPIPAGDEKPSDAVLAELDASLPKQPRLVGGLVLGAVVPKQPGLPARNASIADALDAVRQAAAAVGANVEFVQSTHQAFHPGRTADVLLDGTRIGVAGELLPSLALEHDMPRTVAAYELDLDALIELAPKLVESAGIATLPAATQDVSLVLDAAVPAGDVLREFRAGAGELLEEAHLVDDYRGDGLDDGHKSLTFALRFRAADRTLTAAEATDAKLAGVARVAEKFGATLRE